MSPDTTEIENERGSHSMVWLATAVGAAAGIAALAYARRPRSRVEIVMDRATDLFDAARKEMEPWIGVAAGAAAAATALGMYLGRDKETSWERTGRQAREMASRLGTQAATPWTGVAAAAAVGLASMAYAKQARRRTIRGIDARTADRINALSERGSQVLRRLRNIADEAGKRYPKVREAVRG